MFWGIIPAPITASLFYMGIVAAMGFELSHHVLRAAELSEELRESVQRMDLVASAADFGLWVWDIEGDKIWTTDKGRELFGFAKKEPLDFARFAGRLHPDDREPVRAAVAAAFPNGGDYHAEYRVASGDTPPRWIAARGKTEFGTDGQPLRMRGASIYITERKRSEEALRESEARFRTVANTAPVMIWMAGTDTLCNFFNKRWLDFTGRTLEQELGNGWAEGVHPDDFERCFKTYTTSFGAR
ncbi:MAG: PAS domain-containing protein [Terrimicrobium sp.]